MIGWKFVLMALYSTSHWIYCISYSDQGRVWACVRFMPLPSGCHPLWGPWLLCFEALKSVPEMPNVLENPSPWPWWVAKLCHVKSYSFFLISDLCHGKGRKTATGELSLTFANQIRFKMVRGYARVQPLSQRIGTESVTSIASSYFFLFLHVTASCHGTRISTVKSCHIHNSIYFLLKVMH